MSAKIEPWIRRLALDTVDYIIRHLSVDRDDEKYDLTDHVALRLHFSIAAHAPKQEPLSKSVHKRLIAQGAIDPSVPVSKLKEFERELQSRSRAGKAAMTAKIEPWIELTAKEIGIAASKEYPMSTLDDYVVALIIAAHAPKQEPVSAYCPKCSELLMLPQGTAIKELSEREAYLISEADAVIAEYSSP